MRCIVVFLGISLFSSCSLFQPEKLSQPGTPLVGFSFDGKIENSGILNVDVSHPEPVTYSTSVMGSCLDLTGKAVNRGPIDIRLSDHFNIDDFTGFSVFLEVKKPASDQEEYILAAHCSDNEFNGFKGWKIKSTECGTWQWLLSDGNQTWDYSPTVISQKINDEKWHFLGFTFEKSTREVRLYFDGMNVAILSLETCSNLFQPQGISLGCDPTGIEKRKDTFNGWIDNFTFWGRSIKPEEVTFMHKSYGGETKPTPQLDEDDFSVLTWNIYHGGKYLGKNVGIERITEIILQSGADIICLQETFDAGEKIADRLNFHLYKRSYNLSLISRFPIAETYNVFKPDNSGAARIRLDENQSLLICPVSLSSQPDIGAYVNNGFTLIDSLITWEQKTRGVEIRLILSHLAPLAKTDESVILAGNLNSGSHHDWTEKNKENKKGMVIPFAVTSKIESEGFIDSYRKENPDEVKLPGNTWSPLFRQTFSDRIDYIFFKGKTIKTIESKTIDSHPLGFPSDHAAVLTRFKRIR